MSEGRSATIVAQRRVPAAVVAAVLMLASTMPVFAGTKDACAAIESSLESLIDGQRARGLLRQLNETEADMRAAGCDDERSALGLPPSPRCPALTYRATVLHRYVAAHELATLPSDSEIASRRAALRLSLAELGCSGFASRPDFAEGQSAGNYRTLCVRRCDGYFFPVSWATTATHFKDDEKACQSIYPPGAAELYIQPNPQAADDNEIVSLAGEAYSSQPFAFSFRRSFDRSCAGLFRRNTSVALDLPSAYRRDFNRAAPAPASEFVLPNLPMQTPEAERRVRIVGSASYYAMPETAALPWPDIGP
jgi:hypothetical protein